MTTESPHQLSRCKYVTFDCLQQFGLGWPWAEVENRIDPVIPVVLKETGRSMRDPIPDPLKNNKLLLKLILAKRLTNVDTSTEVSKKVQIAAR